MKPIRIDHANIFDDFKDVLVEMELTKEDKEAIEIYNNLAYKGQPYDPDDVSVLVWVKVEDSKATGINYIAYYPEDHGEIEYPIENLSDDEIQSCIDYVNENYFGNEEKYDM